MDSAPRYEVSLNAALAAIAQVGDLSMGQPLGHSLRVARLAGQLAQARRADPGQVKVVEQVALLRWSGWTARPMSRVMPTANAPGA